MSGFEQQENGPSHGNHIVPRLDCEVSALERYRGVGIPEERLKKIGEPFYSTKDKGTGLGMLVSYKIVEAHRERIRIDSIVNKGTQAEVTFPLAANPIEGTER